MKSLIIITLLNIYFLESTHAGQNIFWTENFNRSSSGCSPNSSPFLWSVTSLGSQGANANDWYINHSVESNMDSCYQLNNDTLFGALYIGYGNNNCDSASAGPFFKKGCDNITNKRVESPTIDCSGKSGVILQFDIMAHYIFPNDFVIAFFSSDNGTTWDTLENKINTGYCPSSTHFGIWEHRNITLPSSADNNPNVKIGFQWTNNDDCLGSEISVAIDNITLSIECDFKIGISTHDSIPNSEFCVGTIYYFDANIDHVVDSISWSFGNGQFSNDTYAGISYTNQGNYLIELFAVDTNGCTSSETLFINVRGFLASIGTSTNHVCPYECIDYSALVSPISINGIPNHYSWHFYDGNPGTSIDMNPQNCYTHAGNYTTYLVVSNPNTSCIASTNRSVLVDTCDYPVLSQLITDPSNGIICVGDCIDFSSDAYDATSYNWSFSGASISSSSVSAPTNVCYTNAGSYNVTLTVSNSTGTTSLTRQIQVHSFPLTPSIIFVYSSSILSGLTTTLVSGDHYEWFADLGLGWESMGIYSTLTLAYTNCNYKLRAYSGNSNCFTESNIVFVPNP